MNKLSVIVPVYNAGEYLRECIDSILTQSMREIELILVDDGSKDESGSICDEYKQTDRRVRVIHQENRGRMEARRAGVNASKCQYVTFVDADDFIASASYALAEASMADNIDVIAFGITRYYDSENQRVEHPAFPEGLYGPAELEDTIRPAMIWNIEEKNFGIDPSLCNKVMKRELIHSVYESIADTDFLYGEDVAVVYPLLKWAKTLDIKAKSYYFHRQRKRTEVAGYIKDSRYLEKLYKLYCHLCREFQDDKSVIRQIEYFYIHSAGLRKWAYEGRKNQVQCLFPFDKVEKGERIVLYGAGAVGQQYMKQLKRLNYCTVELWVDRDFENCGTAGVLPVEAIQTAAYDKVVVAIQNPSVCDRVEKNLIRLGVDEKKIIR